MVAADRVAATVIQGVHGRRRVGQGDAFWQYRPFRDGDSAGRIDWRQSARSRQLFVRETEWEAAASVWLWRDASPSMQYASLRGLDTKAVRAELITLALANLLTDAAERIALLGSGMRPSTGRLAVRRMAEAMFDETRPVEGKTRALASLPPLVQLPAHGSVVLVSDWLDPLDQIENVIRHYSGAGVRGHIVQVLDPAEEDLPFDGHVKFEGTRVRRPAHRAPGRDRAHRLQRAPGGPARGPAAPRSPRQLDGASPSHRQAGADHPALPLSRDGRPASAECGVMTIKTHTHCWERATPVALRNHDCAARGDDPFQCRTTLSS